MGGVRRSALAWASTVAVGLTGLAGQAAASSPAADANAASQIQALQSFKESLTPTQQKIDSKLLLTMAPAVGQSWPRRWCRS